MHAKFPDPGGWLISSRTIDRCGATVKTIPISSDEKACAPTAGVRSCLEMIDSSGYPQVITYHPASQF